MRRCHPLRSAAHPTPSIVSSTQRLTPTALPIWALPKRVGPPTIPACRRVPAKLGDMPFSPTPEASTDRRTVRSDHHRAETQHQGSMGQNGRTQFAGNGNTHGGGGNPPRGARRRVSAAREPSHREKGILKAPIHRVLEARSIAECDFLLEGLFLTIQGHSPNHYRD